MYCGKWYLLLPPVIETDNFRPSPRFEVAGKALPSARRTLAVTARSPLAPIFAVSDVKLNKITYIYKL